MGRVNTTIQKAATQDDLKNVSMLLDKLMGKILVIERKVDLLMEAADKEFDAAETDALSQHTGLSQQFDTLTAGGEYFFSLNFSHSYLISRLPTDDAAGGAAAAAGGVADMQT